MITLNRKKLFSIFVKSQLCPIQSVIFLIILSHPTELVHNCVAHITKWSRKQNLTPNFS